MEVKDKCGKTFQDDVYVNVTEPQIIIVYPPECSGSTCDEGDKIDPKVECE